MREEGGKRARVRSPYCLSSHMHLLSTYYPLIIHSTLCDIPGGGSCVGSMVLGGGTAAEGPVPGLWCALGGGGGAGAHPLGAMC